MIITLLIGLALSLFGIVVKVLDHRAKRWHHTVGTISKAQLVEKISKDSDGNQKIKETVDLEYNYQVPGEEQTLVGDNLFPYMGTSGSNGVDRNKLLEKLKEGTQVKVYYNPNKPSQSSLTVGANYSINYPFSLGLAFLGFALVIWINENSDSTQWVLDQILVN
ncbi:DUF3592 domain-containing protein [Arenibacter latericius]|uniref:DUF3592 domain-containing protein n=1 Tax=Arenibacter latericius TaxID=86104 RepID=UPI0004130F98|nr:DUF3592 domain-containing protein [Arenibacter latericius]